MTLRTSSPSSDSAAAPAGTLALIGGRFEPDNDKLYAALHASAGGRIAILSMASGFPEEVGAETAEEFEAQGFSVDHVPIYYENRLQSAFDESLVARLRACGSVFFTGGDQSRIIGTLLQSGFETPALTCVRELYANGGLISGSSAGAAVMSGPMLLGGTSLHAVSRGQGQGEDDFRLGTGLGLFPWGVVDQHFLQRGRIGRLLVAAGELGERLAFGVDENSALIVSGEHGEVVGETGVLLIDLKKAKLGQDDFLLRDVRVSYLDDGDAVDLASGKPLPAADKQRVRVTKASYQRPAPVRRNAFASYAIHDLMLRLVEGDPAHYREDSANAFDPETGQQVTLTVRRRPRRSRALRAIRNGEIRYSAINFTLDLQRTRLNLCPVNESIEVLHPDPVPEARLVLLGNSPVKWPRQAAAELISELVEPVGVLATASGEPEVMAERYVTWIRQHGLAAEAIPVSLQNIERASRDRLLLRRIGNMGSLLVTGGDQRRLVDTLLHCAEATPVLHQIVSAYERGTPLIAVGGGAAALGQRMITDGDSVAALRFGSSEDASFTGVVVERGIGITALGLIDQNFLERQRLGRLLMACADQRQRFGFGLCEGSALAVSGGEKVVESIGSRGVVIVELDLARVRLAPGNPDPAGITLHLLEPGNRIDLAELPRGSVAHSAAGHSLLRTALEQLGEDYRRATSNPAFEPGRWEAVLG